MATSRPPLPPVGQPAMTVTNSVNVTPGLTNITNPIHTSENTTWSSLAPSTNQIAQEVTSEVIDFLIQTVVPPIEQTVQTTESVSSIPATIAVPEDSGAWTEGTRLALVITAPIAITLLILLLMLTVFMWKRRRMRYSALKRDPKRDEESLMEVTSSLADAGDEDNEATKEPLYAIVDKTKKNRIVEALPDATESIVSLNKPPAVANGECVPSLQAGGVDDSIGVSSITDITERESHEDVQQEQDEPLYDITPLENSQENSKLLEDVHIVKVKDRNSDENLPNTNVKLRNDYVHKTASDKLADKTQGVTLIECDVYEAGDCYDPNRDDEDGAYEIPDSPATVHARRSLALCNSALQNDSYARTDVPITCDEDIIMPHRAFGPDTSDSESELESDFEDMWKHSMKASDDSRETSPPPLPKLLPPVEIDGGEYMSPKCHIHCPPGPDWKPFHEYDPVYVPHSDSAGMAKRLDSQNYVRGMPRNDSHNTNPYEEIQFGNSIYDTVDDIDNEAVDNNGIGDGYADNGRPYNPIKLPPRMQRVPPSPPPPLVPRRKRPISGVADIGQRHSSSFNKPLPSPPQQDYEPRYSGLIMDDVSDLEDDLDHDYTALAYTKLKSVGCGRLMDGHDDIKAIDETDSETYAKQPFKAQIAPPHLTPRTTSTAATITPPKSRSGDGREILTNHKTDNNNKSDLLFINGSSHLTGNGDLATNSTDSSDSDDSYEPFDFDILPPETPT